MNEQRLFSAIQNFEMALCDIKTPQHLKSYFSKFYPIFEKV